MMAGESSERDELIQAIAEAAELDEEDFRNKLERILADSDDVKDVTRLLDEMYDDFD